MRKTKGWLGCQAKRTAIQCCRNVSLYKHFGKHFSIEYHENTKGMINTKFMTLITSQMIQWWSPLKFQKQGQSLKLNDWCSGVCFYYLLLFLILHVYFIIKQKKTFSEWKVIIIPRWNYLHAFYINVSNEGTSYGFWSIFKF